MTTEITIERWTEFRQIFDKLTPDEREEITIEIIKRMDARRSSALRFLMANPQHLFNVSADKLREVVSIGLEDAHKWIIENNPQSSKMLNALECLTAFSLSKDEPTAADLTDVIYSLEDVWKAAGAKYAVDIHDHPKAVRRAQGKKPNRINVSMETKGGKS